MPVTTKMYFFPFEKVGKGPIISQDIFSKGQVDLIVPSGTCGLGCGALCCWHCWHSFSYSFLNIWFISRPVESLLQTLSCFPQPRWPALSRSCCRTVAFILLGITSCVLAIGEKDWNFWHKSPFWIKVLHSSGAELAGSGFSSSSALITGTSWVILILSVEGCLDMASAWPCLLPGLYSNWKSNCSRKIIHVERCPPMSFRPFSDVSDYGQ